MTVPAWYATGDLDCQDKLLRNWVGGRGRDHLQGSRSCSIDCRLCIPRARPPGCRPPDKPRLHPPTKNQQTCQEYGCLLKHIAVHDITKEAQIWTSSGGFSSSSPSFPFQKANPRMHSGLASACRHHQRQSASTILSVCPALHPPEFLWESEIAVNHVSRSLSVVCVRHDM